MGYTRVEEKESSFSVMRILTGMVLMNTSMWKNISERIVNIPENGVVRSNE